MRAGQGDGDGDLETRPTPARASPRRSSRPPRRERIPGPIWAAADTTPPYSASWNTTGFGDGAYDLRVITTDNAVATASRRRRSADVLVDNTAPGRRRSLSRPARAGAYLSAGRIYFKANAAGSFRLVATVADAGSGAGVRDVPGARHHRLDASRPDRHDARGRTLHVEHLRVVERCLDARHVHREPRPTARATARPRRSRSRADSTAPTGAVTAPAAAASVARDGERHARARPTPAPGVASAQFQISPAGAGTWSNLGPPDTADAVRGELGHDDLRRRAVRPARDHDRQRRQHVHLADDRQRARRQHGADGIAHRAGRERDHQGHLRAHVGLGRRRLGRASAMFQRSPAGAEHLDERGGRRHHGAVSRRAGTTTTPATASTTCGWSRPTRRATRSPRRSSPTCASTTPRRPAR